MSSDISLFHGDCLEILPTLGTKFDAVISDPPWKDYSTGRYDASEWHKSVTLVDPNEYCEMLYNVVKQDGAVLLWVGWESFEMHRVALKEAGFNVKNCIVWAKPNHTAGDLTGNFSYQHEMAVFATRENWKIKGKRMSNLWKCPHIFSRAKRFHPTQKPVPLMLKSVEALTQEGDTVLDMFMGSGTTGVACMKLFRKFFGIEVVKMYYDIANARIARAREGAQIEKRWMNRAPI